jgi:uncharacterized protein YqeY
MNLYQKIESDMRAAMKDGSAVKLSVLRMLVSAVKTLEIDKKLKELPETDIIQILQKQIKQHKDSIEQFGKGNRTDLADKELAELKVLETYLPAQMGEGEVEALVKSVIAETGATTKADTGKVMKAVMERAKGACEGKTVNQVVMRFLK